MSASVRDATYSMTMSPPPPADLGSYSRSMHQHTKRQMEAASQPGMRSQSTSQGPPRSHQSSTGPSVMPNGVSVSNASSGMGSSSGRGPAGYN